MKKMIVIWLMLCCGLSRTDVKTSVIIPCYPGHTKFLYSLLQTYEHQTILPDEIVISLSEFHRVDQKIISQIRDSEWPFQVVLVGTNAKKYAGQNRVIACSKAKGDIFICQDADDVPHHQRVEIILYFFRRYNPDHVVHLFKREDFVKKYNIKTIPFLYPANYQQMWSCHVHFGNPAICRKVFERVKWNNKPRGQDINFNEEVVKTFNNSLIINVPLYTYRTMYSCLILKRTVRNQKRYPVQIVTEN